MRTEVRRGRKFIEYVDDSLPAGTFVQEISGADVSYRDDDGKWKPISTKFSAKSGDFAFAADKLNHKIEVGAGGERCSDDRDNDSLSLANLFRAACVSRIDDSSTC